MHIEVGERLPKGTFLSFELPKEGCSTGRPEKIESATLFDGKTVVVVAVPGAFTPTCSEKHIPSFVQLSEKFKEKGADTVACLSTNDPFVLGHWARQIGSEGKLLMLSDGNGTFVKEMGLDQDLSHVGLGRRSQRFAMIVKDGIVKYLGIDSGPVANSSAESVLANL